MSEIGGHTLGQTATPDQDSHATEMRARLYLLFECDRPAASSLCISLPHLLELTIGRSNKRELQGNRLGLPDRWLSSTHARLQDSFGRWILHDAGSKNGCQVNGQTTKRHELQDGDLLELGRSFFLYREAEDEVLDFRDLEGCAREDLPMSLSPAFSQEVGKLERLAATDISILILGESGSGKEVLAQHIHQASGRAGTFVPVNCGALPSGLVESELFGHKKGAFSGAVDDHPGLVRSSDQGTLFLDEIADLPPSSQAVMLRVLQEKEVRAVGATASQPVNLRTVSATHLDLDERVQRGDFRRDLFARIAGYRLTLPPLHERREDLGLLMAEFLAQSGCQSHSFSLEAARALLRYRWPLNIRELRSCLATATVLANDGRIELEHLPEALRTPRAPATEASVATPRGEDDRRRQELLILLEEHQGNVSAVARAMEKDRKQVQRWVKRFGIELERFRQP